MRNASGSGVIHVAVNRANGVQRFAETEWSSNSAGVADRVSIEMSEKDRLQTWNTSAGFAYGLDVRRTTLQRIDFMRLTTSLFGSHVVRVKQAILLRNVREKAS